MPPLPGAPGWTGYQDLIELDNRVLADAQALVDGGVHGLLFENYGDVPFTSGRVDTLTVTTITRLVLDCMEHFQIPFGINVLRNDWESGLAIAATTGGMFIRINVLSGVFATDQGIIEGDAHSVLRYRRTLEEELGRKIMIFADVHVKHGTPLFKQSLEDATADLVERVGVDGIIVTGSRTGVSPILDEVKQVALVASNTDTPVFIGGGTTVENIKELSKFAHGFIIGTFFKKDGKIENPVDKKRVEEMIKVLQSS